MQILGVLIREDNGTLWVQRCNEQAKFGDVFPDVPIEQCELSVRTTRVLQADNITMLSQVAALTEVEFLRIPNAGRKLLNEMREELARHRTGFARP